MQGMSLLWFAIQFVPIGQDMGQKELGHNMSQFHKVVQAYRTRESTLVTASTTSDCHKEFFDKDPRFSLQYRVLASSFSGNLILRIGSACSSSSRLTSCLS